MNSSATLTVGIEDTLGPTHPGGWQSLADVQVGRHIFETLVRERGDHSIAPGVAESWTVGRGGREWRFKIARGLFFHDGSPIDAGAVAGCLTGGVLDAVGLGPFVVALATRGDDGVIIRTAAPVASILHRLAAPRASLVSPRGRHSNQAIGSGPYRYTRSDGVRVVLTRARSDAAKACYAELAFLPLRDGRAMWESVRSGAVDVIYECPYNRVPRGTERDIVDGVVVRTRPSLSVNMLLFNTAAGPAHSVQLRRLIASAIDTEQMLREVHLGVGAVPRGPISPASPFFEPDIERAEPPALTKRQARIHVLATRGYYTGALDFLCRQLEPRLVRCDLELVPFPELIARLRSGRFEAALTGTGGGSDPDLLLTDLFHSRGRHNFARLRDGALDGCIEQARETLDVARRRELYRRAVNRINALAPAVFLRHGAAIVAHRQGVGGLSPRGDHLLELDSAFASGPQSGEVPGDYVTLSCKQERRGHGAGARKAVAS
ncbi:MAG: ABC transporter substrate-binding protein [Actinomycetota bacterium]|nr:ABC transporter substrate-binding protein [Actinomycetota bacterium]